MKTVMSALIACLLSFSVTGFASEHLQLAGLGMENNDFRSGEEIDPYMKRDELVEKEAQDRQKAEQERIQKMQADQQKQQDMQEMRDQQMQHERDKLNSRDKF